ncbi:MAG: substrate-binding domain-containing protein [Pirellulaceae bacterium]
MLRTITLAGLLVLPLLLVGCGGGDSGNGGKKEGTGTASSTAENQKGAAGKKRLIFLTNGDDPFWDTCNAGLQDGAKQMELEAAGYSIVMDKGNFKIDGQIDKLRQYATEPDIVGIAISVVQADNKTIADELKNLQAQGKKIITVDGDLNRMRFRDSRTYYIGTDNFVGGKTLGIALNKVLAGRKVIEGGYYQFAGFTDNDNARSRMNGVQEGIGKDYEELGRKPDQGDRNKAADNVRTALDNDEDKITALVGIWAYNAPAIADVVEERKVRSKVSVATFDAAKDAITAMSAGNIDVMVVQNPFDMGVQSVRLLKAMCENDTKTVKEMFPNDGKVDGDVYTTGLRVVVADEKSPVKATDFDPKVVEFMTLEQFKQWLAKYKLVSS